MYLCVADPACGASCAVIPCDVPLTDAATLPRAVRAEHAARCTPLLLLLLVRDAAGGGGRACVAAVVWVTVFRLGVILPVVPKTQALTHPGVR